MISTNNAEIVLGNRKINASTKPYIIAEIGVNHEGSVDQAKKLIDLAKVGGADAAKFQSYKANTIASINSPSYWDTKKESTKNQHELFKKYDSFNPEDYIKLSEHCNSIEIDFLSTPFDDSAVEFLNPIMPFFKIASADITNIPFIKKIARKKKPVILSTGASNKKEIDLAIKTLNSNGCHDIVLLHCILNYPTLYENANLNMIKDLVISYPKYFVGYSDHTLPDKNMSSLISAYLLGSVVIEKHFTHDKSLPGNDHYHAMDVKDLTNLNKLIDRIYLSLGSLKEKNPIETEEISRLNARRSIVIKNKLLKNHTLNESDLTYKRPGTGISPIYWEDVIGRKLNKRLEVDHILQWNDLLDE